MSDAIRRIPLVNDVLWWYQHAMVHIPTGHVPRVAILGIGLEVNGFAPPSSADAFHGRIHRGRSVLEYLAAMGVKIDRPDWRPLPLSIGIGQSGGPLDAAFYIAQRDAMLDALRQLGDVDGVFVYGHGAGATTHDADLDGDFISCIRRCVGPETPIAIELDLHANLSDRLCRAADIVIGYKTNPHVDQGAQANICISALLQTIQGRRLKTVYRRIPLMTSPVTLLTNVGRPMQHCRADALELVGHNAFDVSLFPGFAYSDCPHVGFTIALTAPEGDESAQDLCDAIARKLWARRGEFVAGTTSIADAVNRRQTTALYDTPTIFADVADNPGGGGRANTVHLLRALCGVSGPPLLAGAFNDPALVNDAALAGIGNTFRACFNREEQDRLSGTWQCDATVERVALCTGRYATGIHSGHGFDFGLCALLRMGGCDVFVTSRRSQLVSPDPLHALAIAHSDYKQLLIKSRGHFRAGFAGFAAEQDILEVDGPGLTSVNLAAFPWRHLHRPIHPLDPLPDHLDFEE